MVKGVPTLGPMGGVTIRSKSFIPGSNGGPGATCASFPEGTGSVAHFHTRAQFQLIIGGAMRFPGERLESIAVHYTHHCSPYGPFTVTHGHAMYVLTANRAAQVYMDDALKDRQGKRLLINRGAKYFTRQAGKVDWEPAPGIAGARRKVLIAEEEGPSAFIIECPPGSDLPTPTPTHGQYQIVMDGSVTLAGRELGPTSLRFVRGPDQPAPLRAGPNGATVTFLAYDEDAEWEAVDGVIELEQAYTRAPAQRG